MLIIHWDICHNCFKIGENTHWNQEIFKKTPIITFFLNFLFILKNKAKKMKIKYAHIKFLSLIWSIVEVVQKWSKNPNFTQILKKI